MKSPIADRTEERPAPTEYAPFYAGYVRQVPPGPVVDILERQIAQTLHLLAGLAPELGEHRYAPGKWSIKEVVGHLADTERILAYRALRFGRGDQAPLPGFDQDAYVRTADASGRTLVDMAEEFRLVRAANLCLFRAFGSEALLRSGTANGFHVTVRGLLYIIAGHELHHMKILREQYLPKLS